MIKSLTKRELPRAFQVNTLDLTKVQIAILLGVAHGLSNEEMARRLSYSHFTIKGYVAKLFIMFGVDTRASLVTAAFMNGILRIEDE
jgi:DNA-binding CsgD family transcriptional regulator